MTHYTTLVQRCRQTNSLLADEIDAEFRRLERVIEGEQEARFRAETALRDKDGAMNVLFDRAHRAGADLSDLIP